MSQMNKVEVERQIALLQSAIAKRKTIVESANFKKTKKNKLVRKDLIPAPVQRGIKKRKYNGKNKKLTKKGKFSNSKPW